MALDWDILNENCSGIADWVDWDTDGGVSSQVTKDGRGCFQFYCGAAGYARRYRNFTIPNTFTYEVGYNVDPGDHLRFAIYTTGTHTYDIILHSTGINVHMTASYKTTTLPTVSEEWHNFRMVVKADRKVDMWLDDRCVLASSVATLVTGGTSNVMQILQYQVGAGTSTSWSDYIRIDTTPEAPLNMTSPFRIYDEHIAIRPAQSVDRVRLFGDCLSDGANKEGVAGVHVVATTDTNASKTRIYDGSAVKALMKLPS